MPNINDLIANELGVRPQQIKTTIELLDQGNTVPFIARYRKEATQGLDDQQLRTLESRLSYLRALEERRQVVLDSISGQGKLTPALKQEIISTSSKTELEDLYLPYRPKRRTKGEIARKAGLLPLAEALLNNRQLNPEQEARHYVDPSSEIKDCKSALEGAKSILIERFVESAPLLSQLRDRIWKEGYLCSTLVKGKEQQGSKFRDYFEHSEKLSRTPSHRALALLRGRNEGVLSLKLLKSAEGETFEQYACSIIAHSHNLKLGHKAADHWLNSVVEGCWKSKLSTQMQAELLTRLKEQSEQQAITVFANNLNDLLMAAPAGPRVIMGLDPGFRTGIKVAIIGATGKLLEHATIYPFEPQKRYDQALTTLGSLCKKHQVELISIGNGTASRETEQLVADLLDNPRLEGISKLIVSEAGASVYSASELASQEFPDLDVSIRGAVSIARRLQDPLAELVKIDPKSIGVGQYQHDVNQVQLAQTLDAVVEDGVNHVGVDLNSASSALLTHVSGLNKTLAKNIVEFRDQNGAFSNRTQLKKVARLGPKAFELSAGFLRIRDGSNPLDSSGVHPEAYGVVKQIAHSQGLNITDLIGNSSVLQKLNPSDFTDENFGLPTLRDIIRELEKPGRDPRPEFKTAQFKEGVNSISDLEPGMRLEGVITNVTNFGAFVDIGVHQDGLVHISALADRFVSDPREIVKTGDLVQVRVVEIDHARKRIALSMRSDDAPPQTKASKSKPNKQTAQQQAPRGGAFADAFAKAKKR
ncbi:Tex family protein [Dongshaea marina]|uniref:Tex family protein n=1 Tax=Dongshaea marina TaxID=2047966 RepID=UPI000D3EC506|nr:Tex family protein [Dongshaea marina]